MITYDFQFALNLMKRLLLRGLYLAGIAFAGVCFFESGYKWPVENRLPALVLCMLGLYLVKGLFGVSDNCILNFMKNNPPSDRCAYALSQILFHSLLLCIVVVVVSL